jgi:predicted nucleic acid-binding protein
MAGTRYLVDSTVWIDYLRDGRAPAAERFARALDDDDELVTTGLVLTEVLQGVRSDRAFHMVLDRMSSFPRVDPDLDDHVRAAELYRAARRRGITIRGTIDCLMAALCLNHDLILMHADRDFEHLATVAPLRSEATGGRT